MSTPTTPEPSDEELMLRAKASVFTGEFETLILRYQGMLMNYFRRLGVHHECEDLVQDTFVRLWKARKRYRVRASFRTFLFCVARTVWQDHLRSLSRRRRKHRALAAEPPSAPAANPAADLGRNEELQRALASLSEAHREVVVLRLVQDFRIQEIADILDIAEGTVKSRLHHALQQLRTWFSEEQSDA